MTEIGLKIYDLLKGTHVRHTMGFLEESQYWSLEELQEFQGKKLKDLLNVVEAEVPFYREYEGTREREYENARIQEGESLIPSRIPEFSNSHTPIIYKLMVMKAGDELLSDKINLKKCKMSRTGGTTGPPLRLYRDTETRSWALAAYYRFYGWMGIEPGMPEVELWGSTEIRYQKSDTRSQKFPRPSHRVPRPGLFEKISKFRNYNAFSFNDAYLEEVVKRIQKFQPKLIRGYLSAIILLAEYIKRNNIKGINPIAVSCTSETLFPEYRKMIEEVFQAPLFNQYGCGECNSIAFECKEHNGMHVSMEHCILESDENNNLIMTNLDNYSQPFIRYKNGDMGVIDTNPCACGNAAPRLTELHGRANENIILKDGSSVNGIFFANLLDQAGFINSSKMLRFQVIQDVAGEIEFKAEVKRQMAAGDLGKIKDALMPFFSKVDISQHQFLDPGTGGKFRYIISNV
ncbi:MAG: hypothetical protein DRJ15_08415 [Bacteroidetes bacterium]|nr:MAG: hypothetical protein DRJ15_08415 [Bacteroidota bacterium]